jgi:mannose-6-phosphate isomerase-like protein (cupin superfamily)
MKQEEKGTWQTPFIYEEFMQGEGIPIHRDVTGVEDVTALPRRPWARTGGLGTFIELKGTFQSERGLFVCEIPGGKALEVQHHLYGQFTLITQGRGATEIWQESGPKRMFEWGPGSIFAPPKNTYYRLYNGGKEPVIFFAITTAPRVMNGLNEIEFVFNCKHDFTEYYSSEEDYFRQTQNRVQRGRYNTTVWYTNFIQDAKKEFVNDAEQMAAGGRSTLYRMAGKFPTGHISDWPVGKYRKAHYHNPGAVLVGLEGKGYVNLWPKELGIHPWQDGYADEVAQIQWGPNSVYTPPDGWFHQHMSTGRVPARHVACYGGSNPLATPLPSEVGEVLIPVREGGPLIEYEDEDPEVRRYFMEANAREGVECAMPPVVYRTDPLPPEVLAKLGMRR